MDGNDCGNVNKLGVAKLQLAVFKDVSKHGFSREFLAKVVVEA